MKKVVLYLEEIDLDLENIDNNDIEFVDEHTEMSIVASHFIDGQLTDEYPSTGRMYVRTNEGNFTVRRIIEADWDEACQIMSDEHEAMRRLIRKLS